ncbi:membrane or secreted protein [Flavobacteriaceae bacterium S0862]|nr:membrane or secreted protein [Flavobacteriaceae bacterium S0862]
MKKAIVLLFSIVASLGMTAQNIIGAYEAYSTSENGDRLRNIVILADGYQVLTVYNSETGKFIHSNGGTWKLEGNTMTEKVEFHTDNNELVGTEVSFEVKITDDSIQIVGNEMILTKIDDGTPGKLQGAWLMSGRVRDGKEQSRDITRPRKTMKMLSGTRFQWIAYNTETKQFMGTGGGTYTTVDGKYTENIEFFSRDDSRVGASLEFDFSFVDGNWHHKGFSSKGDPMHEIWTVRQ